MVWRTQLRRVDELWKDADFVWCSEAVPTYYGPLENRHVQKMWAGERIFLSYILWVSSSGWAHSGDPRLCSGETKRYQQATELVSDVSETVLVPIIWGLRDERACGRDNFFCRQAPWQLQIIKIRTEFRLRWNYICSLLLVVVLFLNV
jgi:hypothetical protein